MPLTPATLADLAAADPSALEYRFSNLPKHWRTGLFLTLKNRYRDDCINRIKADYTDANNNKIVNPHLSEYIAASTLLHAMDGWQLLGNAISSHLHGDPDTARHLAYYAELRGAMSLLATEGIGVFDNKHFVINTRKTVKFVARTKHLDTTHRFTWEALDNWTKNPNASVTVLSIIAPGGIASSHWINSFAILPGALAQIASDWVTGWGLDLKRLKADRESRNLSSYRPTAFHAAPAATISQSLACVSDFWRLSEPNGMNGFATLDAFLLRQALTRLFKSQMGRSSLQAKTIFKARIRNMVHTVGPNASAAFDWERFFRGEQLPEIPRLLFEASGRLSPKHRGHDLQVIARATLMLRLASGSARKLFHSLPLADRALLSFWWRPLAEQTGLWAPGATPADLTDLWADVEIALQASSDWTTATPEADRNLSLFSSQCAEPLNVLSGTQRAGMWALGL